MFLATLLFPLAVLSSVVIPNSVLSYKGIVVPVLVQFDPPTHVIHKVGELKFVNSDAQAKALVDRLQAFTAKSQAAAVALLNGLKRVQYRPYYISNTLAVDAPLETIKQLASVKGIRKIVPNFVPSKIHFEKEKIEQVSKKYKNIKTFPEYNVRFPDFKTPPKSRNLAIEIINAHTVDPKIISNAKHLVFGNLDSGVDSNHPALKANYKGTASNHSYTWFEAARGNPTIPSEYQPLNKPNDNFSHGTRVVSLAVGNHGIGVSPKSKWIACKAIYDFSTTSEDFLKCQQFLLAPTDLDGRNPDPKQRPHVIGNSWTCTRDYNCFNEPFIYASHAHHVAGIFNVAAAGNSGYLQCGGITYPPAENNYSFVVAAVEESSLNRALFSSVGPSQRRGHAIDVSVPGDRILAAEPGNRYGYDFGTSFAAPLAAGGSLLVMAACPHLQRNPTALAKILRMSATPKPSTMGCGLDTVKSIPNHEYGYGLLNVQKAIDICKKTQ